MEESLLMAKLKAERRSQCKGRVQLKKVTRGGGIVHMAANDVFSHVQNTPDRIFAIHASFIEIYNDEVRDLLGENAVLAVREDPLRGVFVNSVEEHVTDSESLLQILFAGEKYRAVASTGMNERIRGCFRRVWVQWLAKSN
jgi:regulator of replication initiation timing